MNEEVKAKWHAEARRKAAKGLCYIVEAEGLAVIKIGHVTTESSRGVTARLNTMQTGSPVRLKVAATIKGGRATESALHERFKKSRKHGEWFERTPEVEELIRKAQERTEMKVCHCCGRPE